MTTSRAIVSVRAPPVDRGEPVKRPLVSIMVIVKKISKALIMSKTKNFLVLIMSGHKTN